MQVFDAEKYLYAQTLGFWKPAAFIIGVNVWIRLPTALLLGMVVGQIINYFV